MAQRQVRHGAQLLFGIIRRETLAQGHGLFGRRQRFGVALQIAQLVGVGHQVVRQRQCFLARLRRHAFQARREQLHRLLVIADRTVQPPEHALYRLPHLRLEAASVELGARLVEQLAHADFRAHRLFGRGRRQRVGEERQRSARSLRLTLGDARLCACFMRLPQRHAGAGEQCDHDDAGSGGDSPVAAQPQPRTIGTRQRHRTDRTVIEPCAQVVRQHIRGGIACFGIATQAGLHDLREAATQCARQGGGAVPATMCGLLVAGLRRRPCQRFGIAVELLQLVRHRGFPRHPERMRARQ